jgi:hypothetical protein
MIIDVKVIFLILYNSLDNNKFLKIFNLYCFFKKKKIKHKIYFNIPLNKYILFIHAYTIYVQIKF